LACLALKVGAVILAAGTASRFRAAGGGAASKLVAPVAGKALVRHVVEAALSSRARPVVIVTGHAEAEVMAELSGCAVDRVHNVRYADGLSTSLQAGIAALGADVAAAVILLADMPLISGRLIDRMVDCLGTRPEVVAIVPVYAGRRGNPVLVRRALFDQIAKLSGDEGARRLLSACDRVYELAADATIEFDVDTPQRLAP
jgi:molybdenum cofactor cytidylyltransferase